MTPAKDLLGAVARGWCHPKNENKEFDSDLAIAIAAEVSELLRASPSEAEHAERLWQIRVELAALVADPKNPDWMPALTNGNPADAECLNKAYALSRSEERNGKA